MRPATLPVWSTCIAVRCGHLPRGGRCDAARGRGGCRQRRRDPRRPVALAAWPPVASAGRSRPGLPGGRPGAARPRPEPHRLRRHRLRHLPLRRHGDECLHHDGPGRQGNRTHEQRGPGLPVGQRWPVLHRPQRLLGDGGHVSADRPDGARTRRRPRCRSSSAAARPPPPIPTSVVTVVATDDLSGVDSAQFSLDGSTWLALAPVCPVARLGL